MYHQINFLQVAYNIAFIMKEVISVRTYVSTYIKKADMLKDKKDKELEMAKADIAQLEVDIRMFKNFSIRFARIFC